MWDDLIGPIPLSWANANLLDAALLLIAALFIISGIRRGLVGSVMGLVVLAASVMLALKYYRPVLALIEGQWELPGLVATILAFLAVLIPAQIVLAVGLAVVASILRPLGPWLGPLVPLNHLLGAIPGLIQGLLVAAILLTPLYVVPLPAEVKRAADESVVAGYLSRLTALAIPRLETLLGQAIDETLLFRSRVVTEPGEKLNFGPLPLPELRDDQQAEADLLALLNAERQRLGLSALTLDPRVSDVARKHSEEMFRLAYFAHRSPVTGNPADRLRDQQIAYRVAGENLAYAPTVDVAHAGLMNSPGHRRNILAAEFSRVGIGVVSAGIYGRMFTQNFVG